MRNIAPTLVALLLALSTYAQAPQKMSYQTVLRNSSDMLIANTLVGMRISIRQGSPTGTAVYVETHTPTTNTNGLASLEIGNGAIVSGTIAAIDWANGPYFIETETDPNGGAAYSITGTSQLLSVPYALYAENSGTPGPMGPPGTPGIDGCDPNNKDSLIVIYNNATGYGYCQDNAGVGHWTVQQLGGTNYSTVASKRSVVLKNSANAYAFYRDNAGNGAWSVQDISGSVGHTLISTDNVIVIYNNATAWAFFVDPTGTGSWIAQSVGGTNHSDITHGDKIIVYNNANGYAFSVDDSGVGSWTVQDIGSTNHSVITSR